MKVKYSKVIVGLVILLVAAYTSGALYAFIKTGSEPTVLTTAFYAFATGELWMLKDIAKAKQEREL